MNSENEKFKIFTNALKQAKEGNLFNYDLWLKDKGINPTHLNLKYFANNFRANPDKMVGNEKIIKSIAEYIGLYLKENQGNYHIPVIGVKGSGKTLLLQIIDKFTNGFNSNLARMIDIIELKRYFTTEFDSEQKPSTQRKNRIQIIDNCEKVTDIVKILQNIRNLKGEGVYITSWTHESWAFYKKEIDRIIPISLEIYLIPFADDNYFLFLEKNLHSIMFSQLLVDKSFPYIYPNIFDVRFVHEGNFDTNFAKYTFENPLISLKLLLNTIKRTFLLKKEFVDLIIIDDVATEMGLKGLKGRLDQLSAQHKLILTEILLSSNKIGVRPMQLVKKFNLDKSTISYHLKTLKDLELLKEDKVGKSKFFRIKEDLVPLIQTYIFGISHKGR